MPAPLSRTDSTLVIGLGRFGSAVAATLDRLGREVLAVEANPATVRQWTGRIPLVEADATDVEALEQLGATEFGTAVVGVATSLEASVLITGNLVDLETPQIWAKAISRAHGRILRRIGAQHVVYPEFDAGQRAAHLVSGRMLDYIEMEKGGFTIVKMRPPTELHGFTIGQSKVRSRYGVTVFGLMSPGEPFEYATPDTLVSAEDVLVVGGDASWSASPTAREPARRPLTCRLTQRRASAVTSEGGHLGTLGLGGAVGLSSHGLKILADTGCTVGAEQPLDEGRRRQARPLGEGRIEHLQSHLGTHDPAAQVGQDQDALAALSQALHGLHTRPGVGTPPPVGPPRRRRAGDVDAPAAPPRQVHGGLGQGPGVGDQDDADAHGATARPLRLRDRWGLGMVGGALRTHRTHDTLPATTSSSAVSSRTVEAAPGSMCPTERSPR